MEQYAAAWTNLRDDPMRVAPPDDSPELTDEDIAQQTAAFLRGNFRDMTAESIVAEALVEADGCNDLHDYISTMLIDGLEGTKPDLCDLGKRVYELCERYATSCAERNS